jgi:hypothetical protein
MHRHKHVKELVPTRYTSTHAVESVRGDVGFGGIKTKGRPLAVMAHLKKSILTVKAETNCLAQALIIAITKITKDPNYVAHRKGRKIHKVVDNLRRQKSIKKMEEFPKFQDHFGQY